MINFNTKHYEMYNYIIHNFLEIEIFNNETDLEDIVDMLMPDHLRREQFQKCLDTFNDLYYWTKDNFNHDMTAFHEVALYYFIDYMAQLQKDIPNFNKIYFDKKAKELINAAAKELKESECEYDEKISLKEYKDFFYDIYYYQDDLFEDTDFVMIEDLYNLRKNNNYEIEERLGINIDYYYEILPLDIQNKYKSKHITLKSEIKEMLIFIQNKIYEGNLSKLFWENDRQINETKIQIILENLMSCYFAKENIEITREALVGYGKVDFKLYKNNENNEKVLIEIKKANNPKLKTGITKQLTQYLKTCDYKNAFYLIICFTDEEYEKATEFIQNFVYTDTFHLYINMSILDVRKKIPASKQK